MSGAQFGFVCMPARCVAPSWRRIVRAGRQACEIKKMTLRSVCFAALLDARVAEKAAALVPCKHQGREGPSKALLNGTSGRSRSRLPHRTVGCRPRGAVRAVRVVPGEANVIKKHTHSANIVALLQGFSFKGSFLVLVPPPGAGRLGGVDEDGEHVGVLGACTPTITKR